MTFRGWPVEALEFYEGLEADNSRTYWLAHKDVYTNYVHAPMTELLEELKAEFGEGKIFRPNRDIRFSADKSPYKTAMAATLFGGGYVQLSSHGLAAGNGMYVMAADQLDRFRRAVDDDSTGAKLERLAAEIRRHGIDVSGHDLLKSAPRGYPKDHPRIEFLRSKGLIAWKSWPAGAWLGKPSAKHRVVEFLRTTHPLNDWLEVQVGESGLPHNR
jgi:uncharacterized protein (TIGR02453 family)